MAENEFPVQSAHVLMFARAIGDDNPVYRDLEAAEAVGLPGIATPPTFVQSSAQFDPEYPLRPRIGEPWFGSGREAGRPDPSSAGILHAEQHFEYHRPLVVGDVLTWTVVPGKSWTKQGRQGGTLEFHETVTEYRDASGELVITARGVRVHTEKGPGRA